MMFPKEIKELLMEDLRQLCESTIKKLFKLLVGCQGLHSLGPFVEFVGDFKDGALLVKRKAMFFISITYFGW